MKRSRFVLLGVSLALSGCTHETEQQQVRHEAQRDAKELRNDLQQAGTEAQKAAEQFRSDTKAAVAGAKDGWKEGGSAGSAPHSVDVNSASAAELAALPGVSESEARRIVRGRPYSDPADLRTRGLLSAGEYDRVRDRLVAR